MPAELLQIQQDVSRGTQVLENLLLLARLDPSKPNDLIKTRIDLADVTHEVLQALAPFVQQKEIHVAVHTSPLQVFGNTELLFTCLRNLVDNAVRYASRNGQLQIQIAEVSQQVEWKIEDNGTEVTEEVLARLGERFYRALGTQTQGSGLGLSICKKIIELHQGAVVFSKSAMGGLQVQILLPQAERIS